VPLTPLVCTDGYDPPPLSETSADPHTHHFAGGEVKGVTGATILDVEQNGKVVTSCGTTGSSGVYCNYES